jgi:hypothetical protein
MTSFRDKRRSKMRSQYDAFDFTAFMDNYMKAHPEVVIDRQRGWNIYWNPQQIEQEKTPWPSPRNPTRK